MRDPVVGSSLDGQNSATHTSAAMTPNDNHTVTSGARVSETCAANHVAALQNASK
jgi:hypothetical protein